MRQALINLRTRDVLAKGTFPTAPIDPEHEVIEIDDATYAALDQPGGKKIDKHGKLTIKAPGPVERPRPPDPDPNQPPPAERPLRGIARRLRAAKDDSERAAIIAEGFEAISDGRT